MAELSYNRDEKDGESGPTKVSVASAFSPLLENQDRWLVLVGGAGSGKSVFCSQKILLRTVREAGHRFLVVRKVKATLRQSCWNEVRRRIGEMDLWRFFEENKAELTLRFIPNGNEILFAGLDDPEKVKSIAGISGMWVEEATELLPADLKQLNLRIRGNMPNYKQYLLSFNPIDGRHFLRKMFFLPGESPALGEVVRGRRDVPGGVSILRTNYLSNPFLGPEDRQVLEGERDANWRRVYTDGDWGMLEGAIYKDWGVGWHDRGEGDEVFYGLDFGFNHPAALVRVELVDKGVYLKQEFYESGLSNQELIERAKVAGVLEDAPIYADSQRPDSIREWVEAGFDARPAVKGAGSVFSGISFVKKFHLNVHPESDDLQAELTAYAWARDEKRDEWKDEPVKRGDDLCLVGDTRVTVRGGEKALRKVKEGDEVLTRAGWRRVVCGAVRTGAGVETVRVVFGDGRELVGTGGHRVWTENRGWARLSSLTGKDAFLGVDGSPGRVVSVEAFGVEDVFNLTVEGQHEYFANGILVANCDALRYAIVGHLGPRSEFEDVFPSLGKGGGDKRPPRGSGEEFGGVGGVCYAGICMGGAGMGSSGVVVGVRDGGVLRVILEGEVTGTVFTQVSKMESLLGVRKPGWVSVSSLGGVDISELFSALSAAGLKPRPPWDEPRGIVSLGGLISDGNVLVDGDKCPKLRMGLTRFRTANSGDDLRRDTREVFVWGKEGVYVRALADLAAWVASEPWIQAKAKKAMTEVEYFSGKWDKEDEEADEVRRLAGVGPGGESLMDKLIGYKRRKK